MSSDDAGSYAFLGEEFLTWLWYRLETEGGDFELSEGRSVGVSLDDYISFAPAGDDEMQQTLRAGTPSRSVEAAAGLRNGRRVQEAKLTVAMGDLLWRFILSGGSMTLRSIALPEDPEDAEGPADRSRDRAANFVLIHEIVEGIYAQFLKLRLRREYLHEDAEQQAQWMASR